MNTSAAGSDAPLMTSMQMAVLALSDHQWNCSPFFSACIAQQIAGPLPAQHNKASHKTRCMQPSCSLQPLIQDGHYGEQRMFASAGWGIFSALSGFLVSKYSIYTAFQLYFALAAFAIIPVCFLKFHAKPHFQQVSLPALLATESTRCLLH